MHFFFFFFNDTATTEIYTLSLHDALPIYLRLFLSRRADARRLAGRRAAVALRGGVAAGAERPGVRLLRHHLRALQEEIAADLARCGAARRARCAARAARA